MHLVKCRATVFEHTTEKELEKCRGTREGEEGKRYKNEEYNLKAQDFFFK